MHKIKCCLSSISFQRIDRLCHLADTFQNDRQSATKMRRCYTHQSFLRHSVSQLKVILCQEEPTGHLHSGRTDDSSSALSLGSQLPSLASDTPTFFCRDQHSQWGSALGCCRLHAWWNKTSGTHRAWTCLVPPSWFRLLHASDVEGLSFEH